MLYVAGQNWDGTDGGGKARMGVATGQTLATLALRPDFVLEGTSGEPDERSIFPNGAVLLPNGTVAVTYMGQANDEDEIIRHRAQGREHDDTGGAALGRHPCAIEGGGIWDQVIAALHTHRAWTVSTESHKDHLLHHKVRDIS